MNQQKIVDKFFSGKTKHFLDRKSERDCIHMSNRGGSRTFALCYQWNMETFKA